MITTASVSHLEAWLLAGGKLPARQPLPSAHERLVVGRQLRGLLAQARVGLLVRRALHSWAGEEQRLGVLSQGLRQGDVAEITGIDSGAQAAERVEAYLGL